MPEAAADKVSVDSMLADAIAKMDALTRRMDALEVGEKHIIKGDDDEDKKSKSDASSKAGSRGDDDDDDDKRKDDGLTAPKTKIKDDAKAAAKGDAGFPPSKMKKDDDGELEIKHGKEKDDSSKSDDDDDKKDDAFPPPKKGAKDDAFPPPKKGAKDDDDDDKKDDAIKADALADMRKQISDQAGVIASLQALLKPRSDDEHAAFADTQARADSVFAAFGERAPRPLEGEVLIDYRKRLATKLKKHSQTWGKVKLSELPESAFKIAEDAIYNDAAIAAATPADLEAGELRMVTKIDPTTGVRSNVFYGKESFVKQMGRPGRRVASFRTLASQ